MKKTKCIFAAALLASVSASSAFAETGTSNVTVFQTVGSAAVRIEGDAAKALFDLMEAPAQQKGPQGPGLTTMTKEGKRMVCSAQITAILLRGAPVATGYTCKFLVLNDGDIETDGEMHTNGLL